MHVDWEARRRHVLSEPSSAGLDAVREAVGGGSIRSDRRLCGGVVCATHLLVVEQRGQGARRLVLKRYPPDFSDAAAAKLEWDCLSYARGCGIATPEPVALDEAGSWFGAPALLMSALDGEVTLQPEDRDAWLGELARALAQIHDWTIDGPAPEALQRPHFLFRWEPWWDTHSSRENAVETTIEDLAKRAAQLTTVFCHGDYHPGNVLFRHRELRGVVDWSSARLAPRVADVAQCRADLALHPGGEAPGQFLQEYEAEIGERLGDLAAWDVLHGDHALHYGPTWVEAFAEVGVRLTEAEITGAAGAFIDDALLRAARG